MVSTYKYQYTYLSSLSIKKLVRTVATAEDTISFLAESVEGAKTASKTVSQRSSRHYVAPTVMRMD